MQLIDFAFQESGKSKKRKRSAKRSIQLEPFDPREDKQVYPRKPYFILSSNLPFFSLDYSSWSFTINDNYDVVFRNPTTGGELTFSLWQLKSKGTTKLEGKKGGWWDGNDTRLIFHWEKFDPTSTATKQEIADYFVKCSQDAKKKKGWLSKMSFLPFSRIYVEMGRHNPPPKQGIGTWTLL